MQPLLPTPPPEDPLPTAAEWLDAAERLGRRNANAIAIATTDVARRPSVRMVLLKELAPAGYAVFYTNYGSRKAASKVSSFARRPPKATRTSSRDPGAAK
jgi:pyridoxamine 5'-phosphate oxidase